MTKVLKSIPAFTLIFGLSVLTSCSKETGSEEPVDAGFGMDSSFDVVLDKMSYSYNAKDSMIVLKKPVCKVGTLGNLVWNKADNDSDTLKAYLKNSVINVSLNEKYEFAGGKFPVGLWLNPDESSLAIREARRFTSDNYMQTVFDYEGSCFMRDFYSQFRKKNAALLEADSVLSTFYMNFQSPSNTFDEKRAMDDIRVVNCNEISLYDDLVSIGVKYMNESSGKLAVAYKSDTCSIDFGIRYAYNKSDCSAAYEDFKEDKRAKEDFDFEDYWKTVSYNEYCVARLVLSMKEDQKIPLSKRLTEEPKTDLFAKSIVSLILEAMK